MTLHEKCWSPPLDYSSRIWNERTDGGRRSFFKECLIPPKKSKYAYYFFSNYIESNTSMLLPEHLFPLFLLNYIIHVFDIGRTGLVEKLPHVFKKVDNAYIWIWLLNASIIMLWNGAFVYFDKCRIHLCAYVEYMYIGSVTSLWTALSDRFGWLVGRLVLHNFLSENLLVYYLCTDKGA